MPRVVVLILTALLAAACAQPDGEPTQEGASALPSAVTSSFASSPSADPYLPTYPPMESLPAAQVGGRLVLDDGCLWLEGPEYRALPLWPADSRIERQGDTLTIVSGGSRAEVGTEVIGGGGEYTAEHYDFVVELIGEQIPPACRGDGSYWLVYELEATDE